MKLWEVWYADFPFEDSADSKDRPVIVFDIEDNDVMAIKITSHNTREYDHFDMDIPHWREAGLTKPSVARLSKAMFINKDKFRRKIGEICSDDRDMIMATYTDYISNS